MIWLCWESAFVFGSLPWRQTYSLEKRGEFRSLGLNPALCFTSCVLFSLFEPWKNIKLAAAEVGKGLGSAMQGSWRESDKEVERRKWLLEGGSGQPRAGRRDSTVPASTQQSVKTQSEMWNHSWSMISRPWDVLKEKSERQASLITVLV